MYMQEKEKMGYEDCYSNTFRSELLAKARTNSLQLAEWYGRGAKGKENTSCPLCKHPKEDLVHFLIECKHLESKRNTNLINETKKNKNTKSMQVRMLLFKFKKWDEISEMIQQMWNERKKIIEHNNNNNSPKLP